MTRVPDPPLLPVPDQHPDRRRWNAKFAQIKPVFEPHPLLATVLAQGIPPGPVLELACGLSGSALALAAAGHEVWAVDIADVALERLGGEAERRGLGPRLRLFQADLLTWPLPEQRFSLVLTTRYWEPAVFPRALAAVAGGGLLAWEAFTLAEQKYRPTFRREWCLGAGEPATLLGPEFLVLEETDQDDGQRATRRLIARRLHGPKPLRPGWGAAAHGRCVDRCHRAQASGRSLARERGALPQHGRPCLGDGVDERSQRPLQLNVRAGMPNVRGTGRLRPGRLR
jgi:SAM-dependent methyltransferase